VKTRKEVKGNNAGEAVKADGLVFIEIHTGCLDCPEALRSAGRSMAKANRLD
jgi:indolepyruvate decarboxylase